MKDEHFVKDLYEAGYLQATKKTLIRLERENNFFWFVFQDKADCEKLAASYWAGTAVGNIKDFADSLKTLKERLFSHKNGYENERKLHPTSK